MDRRGTLGVLGAVALVGIVVAVIALGGGDEGPRGGGGPARVATTGAAAGGGGGGGGGADLAEGALERGGATEFPPGGDGGVAAHLRASVAVRSGKVTPTDPDAPRVARDPMGLRTNTDEENRTTGWRVGRTRRRVAILESRVEQLGEQERRLRAEGQSELADRQRAVIDRSQRLLDDLRADERELRAQAEADGTIGDEGEGFGDAPEPARPGVQGALPPGEPR